jgi:hypothetical protein
LPFGLVRRPACEFGPPNLARFSFVSGTGSMAVTLVVALAFWPEVVAAAAPVSVAAGAASVAEAPSAVPVAAPVELDGAADEPLMPVSPDGGGDDMLLGSLTAPLVELDWA